MEHKAINYVYHDGLAHFDKEEWFDVDGFSGWAVTECNCQLTNAALLEDGISKEIDMTINDMELCNLLYDERGDLLDARAISAITERPFYMVKALGSIEDQVNLIEHITNEAHDLWNLGFHELSSLVTCEDGAVVNIDGIDWKVEVLHDPAGITFKHQPNEMVATAEIEEADRFAKNFDFDKIEPVEF